MALGDGLLKSLVMIVMIVVIGADAQQEVERPAEAFHMELCFGSCVRACLASPTLCDDLEPALSLVSYDCQEKCQYNCAMECTDISLSLGGSVWKFKGKWPQHRVMGVQEPFAVLFSFANALVHAWYLPALLHRRLAPSPYTRFFVVSTAWSIVTWVFSAVFHACETKLTEKLDYFGANAHLFLLSYCTAIRCLNLESRFAFTIISGIFVSVAAGHWSYMSFVEFDYALNMSVMVTMMALQSVLSWLFVIRNPAPYNWKFYSSSITFWLAAILFEVYFDFPPIYQMFDAHTIWHAISPFPLAMYYQFLVADLARHATTQRSQPLHLDSPDSKTR